MTRDQLYFLFKDVLSRYGAIPAKEEKYCGLMDELLNIYEQKRGDDNEFCF